MLEVLAWIPYGHCHYGTAFVWTIGYIGICLRGTRTWKDWLRLITRCRGNLAGPTRIDKLLGIEMYTLGLKESAVVCYVL